MINEHDKFFTRKHIHDKDIESHLTRIQHEFEDGFHFLQKYPRSVTIFGSSMLAADSVPCRMAGELSEAIVKDLKYAVITGGGPGIMEAASKGAKEAGGQAVGLNVSLPHEHGPNIYTTDHMKFAYFFSRKTMLTFAAEAYIFFPGGFGTFDELFSILTLIQTGKIPHVPVILFDSDFWSPIIANLVDMMNSKYQTVDPDDFDLCKITDSVDEAIKIIREAPVSEWWRIIN
ncbi:MAG: TIGR00730 family Rossman fold protein [Candidatus Taylorbacteria bacterium]